MTNLDVIYQYKHRKQADAVLDERREGEEVDYIELHDGIRMWVKGRAFPYKGIPTADAIAAVNTAKRLVLVALRTFGVLLVLIPKHKLLRAWGELVWPTLAPHVLLPEYLTPQARDIEIGIRVALYTLGYRYFDTTAIKDTSGVELYRTNVYDADTVATIIAHIFEYDAAYRDRLMDLASDTTQQRLTRQPLRETRRLLHLWVERENHAYMRRKVRMMILPVTLLLCIPKYRKALRAGVNAMEYDNLLPDVADQYWMGLKKDYQYCHVL